MATLRLQQFIIEHVVWVRETNFKYAQLVENVSVQFQITPPLIHHHPEYTRSLTTSANIVIFGKIFEERSSYPKRISFERIFLKLYTAVS